ncbi:excinuclease ABC subunit UvrA [Stratiformator vulcanicus]|uniref:UvrABC system protein A n=1 Tax=Stratiformator vulcanicus TaxID=2527980 RepID=A0A517R1Z3_9PLAN|nr:excinuclease ABC subunit UvrA [Stratiformator vulcanicus]QDT37907.1 UvrABC system protein A [Stratiformator vulcanicus]
MIAPQTLSVTRTMRYSSLSTIGTSGDVTKGNAIAAGVDFSDTLSLRNVSTHNLRGIDIEFPLGKLVVVCGVSGSGKSSLVFDTVVAEGARRYWETIATASTAQRPRMPKPRVDFVRGIPPIVAVGQQTRREDRGSTVASLSDILPRLSLLFGRLGIAHDPDGGRPLVTHSIDEIVDALGAFEARTKFLILGPLRRSEDETSTELIERVRRLGFARIRIDGEVIDLAEVEPTNVDDRPAVELVVDRLISKEGIEHRIRDAVRTATDHAGGICIVSHLDSGEFKDTRYLTRPVCEQTGRAYPSLEPRMFRFESPAGACAMCGGTGTIETETIESETTPDLMEKVCPDCDGARLDEFSRHVRLGGLTFHEVMSRPIGQALEWLQQLADDLDNRFRPGSIVAGTASRAIPEIAIRLKGLLRLRLGYLSLGRAVSTLSGGEMHRTRLAGAIGAGFVGTCYVLDEPTSGLHPSDVIQLIDVLKELRDQGNSLIVVEHDRRVVEAADYVIEVGPGAGVNGGRIVFSGGPDDLSRCAESVTARFLGLRLDQSSKADLDAMEPSSIANEPSDFAATLRNCTRNNLKSVSVEFPRGLLTCVTGVSGSGKSTLVMETLVPAIRGALSKDFGGRKERAPKSPSKPQIGSTPDDDAFHEFSADVQTESITRLAVVDRRPVGRSPLSVPATYLGIWDEIRKLFARTREARTAGFRPSRFAFTSKSGRCPACRGRGIRRMRVGGLPDQIRNCETCHGRRFNRQTLAVRYKGCSVGDVLDMRVDDAQAFFESVEPIHKVLDVVVRIGLGYLPLGQSSTSLSGGEAQRLRLARHLTNEMQESFIVLDEPSAGLHPADICRLTDVLLDLRSAGHTVVAIEHDLEMIRRADYVIEVGPGAGDRGGLIVAAGPMATVVGNQDSLTGKLLRDVHHQAATS